MSLNFNLSERNNALTSRWVCLILEKYLLTDDSIVINIAYGTQTVIVETSLYEKQNLQK